VMNAERFKDTQPHLSYLVKEIKKSDPKLWHTVWCHCNDSKDLLRITHYFTKNYDVMYVHEHSIQTQDRA